MTDIAKPVSTWRKVFAAILDFIFIMAAAGYLIGYLTGGLTENGFKLDGGPALILFAVIVAYFVVGSKYLGGTVWQRILGTRRQNSGHLQSAQTAIAMRIKLNRWQRYGVVVSVIWIIGFAGYFWDKAEKNTLQVFNAEAFACLPILGISINDFEKGRAWEDIAKNLGTLNAAAMPEFMKCFDAVRGRHSQSTFNNFKNISVLIAEGFGTIIIVWLVAWVGIVAVRRIRRGFA
jgi:hypothetical protein